ncbi:MAG: hypothetical protein RLZZ401_1818 [Pseudomonadota bacterium]|jgi:hypothetical protein
MQTQLGVFPDQFPTYTMQPSLIALLKQAALPGLVAALSIGCSSPTGGAAPAPLGVKQVIVKFKPDSVLQREERCAPDFFARLGAEIDLRITPLRRNFAGAYVVGLPVTSSGTQMRQLLTRLTANAQVDYAEPDTVQQIATASAPMAAGPGQSPDATSVDALNKLCGAPTASPPQRY